MELGSYFTFGIFLLSAISVFTVFVGAMIRVSLKPIEKDIARIEKQLTNHVTNTDKKIVNLTNHVTNHVTNTDKKIAKLQEGQIKIIEAMVLLQETVLKKI